MRPIFFCSLFSLCLLPEVLFAQHKQGTTAKERPQAASQPAKDTPMTCSLYDEDGDKLLAQISLTVPSRPFNPGEESIELLNETVDGQNGEKLVIYASRSSDGPAPFGVLHFAVGSLNRQFWSYTGITKPDFKSIGLGFKGRAYLLSCIPTEVARRKPQTLEEAKTHKAMSCQALNEQGDTVIWREDFPVNTEEFGNRDSIQFGNKKFKVGDQEFTFTIGRINENQRGGFGLMTTSLHQTSLDASSSSLTDRIEATYNGLNTKNENIVVTCGPRT